MNRDKLHHDFDQILDQAVAEAKNLRSEDLGYPPGFTPEAAWTFARQLAFTPNGQKLPLEEAYWALEDVWYERKLTREQLEVIGEIKYRLRDWRELQEQFAKVTMERPRARYDKETKNRVGHDFWQRRDYNRNTLGQRWPGARFVAMGDGDADTTDRAEDPETARVMIDESLRGDRFCENGHCLMIGWDKCHFCEQTPNMPSAVWGRLTANRREPSGKVEYPPRELGATSIQKGGSAGWGNPCRQHDVDIQIALLCQSLPPKPSLLGRLIVALSSLVSRRP